MDVFFPRPAGISCVCVHGLLLRAHLAQVVGEALGVVERVRSVVEALGQFGRGQQHLHLTGSDVALLLSEGIAELLCFERNLVRSQLLLIKPSGVHRVLVGGVAVNGEALLVNPGLR